MWNVLEGCPSGKWKSRLGNLLLVVGTLLAFSVLLADLAAALASGPTLSDHGGHAGVAVSPAHSTISLAFALLGPPVVLTGLILSFPESIRSVHGAGLVAGLTLLYTDGVLHWLAVLEHLGEPVSAGFFILSGIVQVGAVPLVRRRERALWWVGVAATVFFVELYVITRIVPPPFALEPESLESLGTLSKAVELGVLAGLGIFFGSQIVPIRLRSALVRGPCIAVLFLGVVVSLVTVDFEGYQYWRLLPRTVFVVTALLLAGLVVYASLAHYLRTALPAALTWSLAAMIIILHAIYAVNYAVDALALPLVLCLASGGLLSASMLTAIGRPPAMEELLSRFRG